MDETATAEQAMTRVIREAMAATPDANTLEKLADKTGIPYSTLSRQMSHQPDLLRYNHLIKILDALGVSLVDFAVRVERARTIGQVA